MSMLLRKCYNQIMVEILSDTRPEVTKIQMDLLRKASPARRLALLAQMNQTVKVLALAGLRSNYPDETSEQLHRRLADLLLGPELACKVYGPVVEK
jgi:hypothetical protein